MTRTDTSPLQLKIEDYTIILRRALAVAEDPYQPPEVICATARDVFNVALDLRLEWAREAERP